MAQYSHWNTTGRSQISLAAEDDQDNEKSAVRPDKMIVHNSAGEFRCDLACAVPELAIVDKNRSMLYASASSSLIVHYAL
jgi:hypothetical protein